MSLCLYYIFCSSLLIHKNVVCLRWHSENEYIRNVNTTHVYTECTLYSVNTLYIYGVHCTRNKQINQRINIKRTFVYASVLLCSFFHIFSSLQRTFNCKNVLNSKSRSFDSRIRTLFTCIFIFLKSDEQNEMSGVWMNSCSHIHGSSSVLRPTMVKCVALGTGEQKNIIISLAQIILFPYLFLNKQCANHTAPTPFCNI